MTNVEDKSIETLLRAAQAPTEQSTVDDSAIPQDEVPQEITLVDTKPLEDEVATTIDLTDETSESPEEALLSGHKTIEQIVKEEAKESDDQPVSNFSLSRTLGGAIVAKAVQKQIWLVLLIMVFLIIYISNRYVCQQQIVKIDKLERQLVEIRFKATVATSELTERSRESNIIKMLEAKGDSTLTMPTTPPYKLTPKE